MPRKSIDQLGREWDIVWGTPQPGDALKEQFGVTGRGERTGDFATFQDPIYPNETKILSIYTLNTASEMPLFVEEEITPGAYAVGVLL